MLRMMIVALAVLACSAAASAQTVTSYTLKVFNVGATAPVSTTTLPAASWVCNQAPIAATGTVTNPSRVTIDDVANAGKVCVFTDTGTGPLLSLPFSNTQMNATISATNSTGLTSPDSVASNSFTRPGVPPPAPTGTRVAQ